MAVAVLADGSTVEFVPDMIGEGAMKQVYSTSDKSSVVCFYKNPNVVFEQNRIERLDAILGRFNPTTGNNGDYYKRLFCWPTGIVIQPQLGIITPAYPKEFVFSKGKFSGKEKESSWFVTPKLRKLLEPEDQGNWVNYFQICIHLARSIKRLHLAGLAHSDLSNRNVLIDPNIGQCLIIDIDSLVVPGLFPPDVLGTRGYIAPEVLTTIHLSINDSQRQHPCAATDQHALAVLIYQYLLRRHPLEGPKVHPAQSAEEQERLEMGSQALFIEHPTDTSNYPSDLKIPAFTLGPHLHKLFEKAFVQGLHQPKQRPTAIEWERGLIQTWDLFLPCDNPNCPSKWFILYDQREIKCPFCETVVKHTLPILNLRKQHRSGQWIRDRQVVVYHNLSLFKWHACDNIFPSEDADKTPQAYCVFHDGDWLMINQNLTRLVSPQGSLVQPRSAIKLEHGCSFWLSQDVHGRMVDVQMLNYNS